MVMDKSAKISKTEWTIKPKTETKEKQLLYEI